MKTTTVPIQQQISIASERLKECRDSAAVWERQLQRLLGEHISAHENGLRDWARQMGISAQYACDIRHGRRKISDAMVAKILGTPDAHHPPRQEKSRRRVK